MNFSDFRVAVVKMLMTKTDTDSKLVGSRLLVWNVIRFFAPLPTPLWNIQSPTSTIKQPVLARSCHVLSFVSKDICFLCFFLETVPLYLSQSLDDRPPPPPLIWRSGSAGGLHRERYVLLAGQFWLLYPTLSNRNGKHNQRSGLISASSIHSLISLTWSRLISGYGKHNIS